ncbi:hypothetical protein [Isoptericola sp. b408]|uniref:hypothetical protein n=1 Tax=Isoptericola sp. b408 TaxID=3064653 RepID=UPI00271338E6|nr:hypothetical protein [Isoptericola sp. b408]MDO8151242.1 hypothetical protein [Isoptericola sp. b408]
MVRTFERFREAEAMVPVRPGRSTTASVVEATLEATFGVDAAKSLRPVNQSLMTVGPRTAMKADIAGLGCTVYADPGGLNVLTPGIGAEGHLRAHATPGSAIRSDRHGDISYAMVGYADDDKIDDADADSDDRADRVVEQ